MFVHSHVNEYNKHMKEDQNKFQPYKSIKYAKGKNVLAAHYYTIKYNKRKYQICLCATTTDKCVFVDIYDITGDKEIDDKILFNDKADITDIFDAMYDEVDINEFKNKSTKLSSELDKMVQSFILRFTEIWKLNEET